MDWLDLIPIVPPGLPGEHSADRTPAQRLGTGVATVLLPAINFMLVLLAGFAAHAKVALVAMPLISASLVFLLARRLAISAAWALALAIACAAFCLIGNAGALFLVGLAHLFRDLG
jgi:hypothetical protein